jgi:hypothetical protein
MSPGEKFNSLLKALIAMGLIREIGLRFCVLQSEANDRSAPYATMEENTALTNFSLRPLTSLFGVEVSGIQLDDAALPELFPRIRALFEEHSVLLFSGQTINDAQHIAIESLFDPTEDRKADERKLGEKFGGE